MIRNPYKVKMTSSKVQPIKKGLVEYCEKIIEIISFASKAMFRYSGMEFIFRKFYPSKYPQPLPTGLIWLVGIYVAFYGVASQRYENRVDIIENRANSIFTQLATDVYKKALGRIATVQNMWCPEKPEILNPPSVFRSLFKEIKYQELVKLLKETIEDWKDLLSDVNLYKASLSGANLEGASLSGANLEGANLNGADLNGANLEGANLTGARLTAASLKRANLVRANLDGADLYGANLDEADLDGANLKEAILKEAFLKGARNATTDITCAAKSLYKAQLDPELLKKIRDKCRSLFE
jgi:hypothetical protein